MKPYPYRGVVLLTGLAAACCLAGLRAFGVEGAPAKTPHPSVKEVEKEISALEDTWKAGKRCKYFIEAAKLTSRLREVEDKKEAMRAAARILESMVSKEITVNEIADYRMAALEAGRDDAPTDVAASSDLDALFDLAYCITGYGTYEDEDGQLPFLLADERRKNAKLLAALLGRVRKERIHDYKERETSLNVVPPVDTGGFGFSGMHPKDVKDPVARAKYLAALRENVANGIWNWRQQELKKYADSRGTYFGCVENYLILAFAGQKGESPLFTECAKKARLTDEEKRTLLDSLEHADPGMQR